MEVSNKLRNIPLHGYVQLLLSYLRPQWKAMLGLTILLSAGIGLALITPQIIRYFIDTAQQTTHTEALLMAALAFIAVSLLHQAVTVAGTYLGENIGWIATNKLRSDVAAHCLRLDMGFHKSHTSGAIIERVDGDINSLANFFSSFVISLMSNVILMLGILLLLFRESWLIGVGMTLFVVFAFFALQKIRRRFAPYWKQNRQMSAEFYGFLGEHLEGTEDTRANGATGFVMHRFFMLLRKWLPIRVKAFLGWMAMWNTTIFVFTLGTAMAFALSAYLFRQGQLTIGTVYMIFFYQHSPRGLPLLQVAR